MNRVLLSTIIVASFVSGCATVPEETMENTKKAKQFNPPTEGNAGLYIYRTGGPGGSLKKDIWVDDKCVGESAPKIFFYEEVVGNTEHKISTESEFSPNDLIVETETGKNYFINQYIKFGVFVGGADLKLVDEKKAKAAIGKLKMAKKGNCSR